MPQEPNKVFTEQDARIVINRKLQEAGWILEGSDRNVLTEQHSEAGFMDYLLLDRNGRNIALVEAKKDSIDPYLAKGQARGYAEANNCQYVFLANSEQLYFWDLEDGDANSIRLIRRSESFLSLTVSNSPSRHLKRFKSLFVISTKLFAISPASMLFLAGQISSSRPFRA